MGHKKDLNPLHQAIPSRVGQGAGEIDQILAAERFAEFGLEHGR